MELKIKITSLTAGAAWFYSVGKGYNWNVSDFDQSTDTQVFTSILDGKPCELKLFFNPGEFLIEYFEMGATKASRKKHVVFSTP